MAAVAQMSLEEIRASLGWRKQLDKLFVTVGKRDKAAAKDLVGAMTRELGMAKGDIGKVDVRDAFSLRRTSRCRGATSGMPSPMKTGITWMSNSSISPASRKDAISSPPPIIQMCLPGAARSRRANVVTASDTNSTPSAAGWGGMRENT